MLKKLFIFSLIVNVIFLGGVFYFFFGSQNNGNTGKTSDNLNTGTADTNTLVNTDLKTSDDLNTGTVDTNTLVNVGGASKTIPFCRYFSSGIETVTIKADPLYVDYQRYSTIGERVELQAELDSFKSIFVNEDCSGLQDAYDTAICNMYTQKDDSKINAFTFEDPSHKKLLSGLIQDDKSTCLEDKNCKEYLDIVDTLKNGKPSYDLSFGDSISGIKLLAFFSISPETYTDKVKEHYTSICKGI